MRVADFHFELPEELIAQAPPPVRGSSRMLALDRAERLYRDDFFRNLPALLTPGDLLILNDSRVIPARLYATRARALHTQEGAPDPSGRIEVLLTGHIEGDDWNALVRPSRKIQAGERLCFAAPDDPAPLLEAEVLAAGEYGERTLRFAHRDDFRAVLDRIGHIPLPPYIHRSDSAADRDRYQTVYARQMQDRADNSGSAAAPTAGLHFTAEILDELRQHGVQVEKLTLHVGLGTFQPVRVTNVEEIRLHEEHYTLPPETVEAINRALHDRRRIIAAGTTVTRTLEHCATHPAAFDPHAGIRLQPHSGATSIFIRPGHRFRIVSGLLTNFHLPESTLLMLVSAFAGREFVLSAYNHAVRERYRFFSYGDCMLVL
ncbi:MAG: tRNA preQ1(34) S-adenosylmethionine ribosyltransferase-isomerase QueA [Acidobacteriaceae bacterium]|nr:tRNA preQ1(34) S-adenosylmethionine ribosyltransferase-isomerase QueA [Acidobacteriaceae bacterium]